MGRKCGVNRAGDAGPVNQRGDGATDGGKQRQEAAGSDPRELKGKVAQRSKGGGMCTPKRGAR